MMKLQEKKAREVLKTLGYKSASEADVNDLPRALTYAANNVGDTYEPKDEADARLYKSLMTAVDNGEAIEVLPSEEPANEEIMNRTEIDNGSVATATKTKKRANKSKAVKAKDKAPAKKDAAPTEKAEKKSNRPMDKWGSYVGSSNAKVNSVLSKKPKTFAQICEAAELSRGKVRYKHLEDLVARGIIVKDGKTWAIKS